MATKPADLATSADAAARLFEQGQVSEAIAAFKRLLPLAKLGSHTAQRLLRNLANCHFACGEWVVAADYAMAALRVDSEDQRAALIFAKSLFELGKYDHAESILLALNGQSLRFNRGKNYGENRGENHGANHGEIDLILGELYLRSQRLVESKASFIAARENAPNNAAVLFKLGEVLRKLGETDSARAAYLKCLEIEPRDRLGARAALALLEGDTADSLGTEFVAALFDDFAPKFDQSLTRLGYRAPQLLREKLSEFLPLDSMLDLGCGTGLMGKEMSGLVESIDGVDLSAKMLELAKTSGIYRRLEQAELLAYLQECSHRYELIIAADVLVYCGDLAEIFHTVAARLTAHGVFAFTVESLENATNDSVKDSGNDSGDFYLHESRRFRHSRQYLERLAVETGFTIHCLESLSTRLDRGAAVSGWLVLLKRETL